MDLAAGLADDLHGVFPVFVDAHGGAVYSLALRLGGPTDAEDIAQETFLRAYAALGRYGADQVRGLYLRPWVVTIALNVVRNRDRRAARHPQTALDHAGDVVGAGPDRTLEGSDLRSVLASALLRLPPTTRQAVVLRHVLGCDTAQTASMLDRPEGTGKAQVSRGLTAPRRQLELVGITLEDHS